MISIQKKIMKRYKIDDDEAYDYLLNRRICSILYLNGVPHKIKYFIGETWVHDNSVEYEIDIDEEIPLEHLLEVAISNENYQEAARLRDKIIEGNNKK